MYRCQKCNSTFSDGSLMERCLLCGGAVEQERKATPTKNIKLDLQDSPNSEQTKKCPSCKSEISSGTTRCPYCGRDFTNWGRRHPVLAVLLVILVLPVMIGILSGVLGSSGSKVSTYQKTQSEGRANKSQELNIISEEEKKANEEVIKKEQEAEQVRRESKVNEISNVFCSERQGEYAYGVFFCSSCIDLEEVINGSEFIRNAKSPATRENCEKITHYCLALWSEGECQRIAEQKIWLGMTRDQLLLSWGVPRDMNDTVGSWGVNTQWVYGDFGPCVYLEGSAKDKLTVTSWQD